jgi:hypothetical protein
VDYLPNAAGHIGTIVINNGDQFTTNVSVTLNLSAVNDGTGVSQMQFSNDNLTWSTPEPYQTTRLWQLLNDGVYPPQMNTVLKTVYVRYQDGAGIWSKAVSDSIVLARSSADIPQSQELWIMQQEPANYDPTQPPGSQRNPGIVPPPPNEAQVDQALYTMMNTYGGYQAEGTPTNPPPPTTNMTVLTLHLGPGIYETHGDNNLLRTTSAWNPQPGWRIIGAGKDATTLKQVQVRNGWGYRVNVVGSPNGDSACYDNFELSDLTLDANIREGETNVTGRFACGINFVGNNLQVRRVRVKNFGSYVSGAEPAGIRMQNFGSINGTYNTVLEDCEIVQPQVGSFYKSPMIALAGEYASGTNMAYYYNVVVRNCYINGAVYDGNTAVNPALYPWNERGSHALGVGGTWGAVLEDNLVLNTVEGYYVDEATLHDVLVRNNHFRGVLFGAVLPFGTMPDGSVSLVEDVFRFENNLVEFDPHLYTAGDLSGSSGARFGFQMRGDLKGPDDYVFNHLVISNNVFQFNDQAKPDPNLSGLPGYLNAFRNAEVRDNRFLGLLLWEPLRWDNAPAIMGQQVDIANPSRSVPLVCSNNLREDGTVLEAFPFVLDSSLPRPVVIAGESISFPAPALNGQPATVVIGVPLTNAIDPLGTFQWNTSVADVGQYVASFYDSTNRIHDPRRTLITVVARNPGNNAQYFANGLLGFWKFEETSGPLLYDSSGNNYTLDAYNALLAGQVILRAPGCAPGKMALQFPGGTAPFPPPFTSQLLNGFPDLYYPLQGGPANIYQAFTISFWLNAAGKPATPQLLLNLSAGFVCSLVPGTNSAANICAVSVTSYDQQMSLMTPSTITIGTWHHVAIAFDGFTSRMYVDGLQSSEDDFCPLKVTGGLGMAVGGQTGLANYAGEFAELTIWNRPLSDQEIAQLHSDQAAGANPSVTPLAPSVLLAQSSSSNTVALSWQDNSMNEGGFVIARGTDGTNFAAIANLGPNTVSFSDTVPQPGTAYYYRVTATNSFGSSDYSNVATVGQNQPAAPTGLRLIGASIVATPSAVPKK